MPAKSSALPTEALAPLNVANIVKAHPLIDSGRSIGKLTIKR